MKHNNPDVLLRLAQGDAYAIAVEYVDHKRTHKELYNSLLRLDGYKQHPEYDKLYPGFYSDDTQMSCSVAETLLKRPDDPRSLTTLDFSNGFFEAFKRDPRDGYSRAFQKILDESKTADEMRSALVPNSKANGAAMRSVPLGFLKHPADVIHVAGIQAQVTHATWGGIQSSAAVGLMSYFAHQRREALSSMRWWCSQHLPLFDEFREPWVGPVHNKKNDPKGFGVGVNTAWAVCTLIQSETSLLDIMFKVLDWGGDTDSVAAIAWGIASARYPNEVLPDFMERDLEPGGVYGPSYLKSLGTRLNDTFSALKT